MTDMVERVARAFSEDIDPPFDELPDWVRQDLLKGARLAIEAMKYADGLQDDILIDIAVRQRQRGIDAVSVAEIIDAYLDAALNPTPPKTEQR